MKRLYARFVLWLIQPALNLRAGQEAKFIAEEMGRISIHIPANHIDV
ncbi:hypothetical protein PAN31117_03129 [Pandoraea anapnoica]|uniref:Uncharacterized protein n=1 Tax=Pandoraea anapnoica TaxID=2508301 RepID=A0A5E5A6S3_9BURK|nr:hypothetical protein PAN31117_03129 [Pandoraea anapnoica]